MSKPKNIDYSALDENNTRGQGFGGSNSGGAGQPVDVVPNHEQGSLATTGNNALGAQGAELAVALGDMADQVRNAADQAAGPLNYILSGQMLQDELMERVKLPKPRSVFGSVKDMPRVQLPVLPGKAGQKQLKGV